MGKLIWLASYPKSGNTWLRVFLAALIKTKQNAEFDLDMLAGFNAQASHYQCYRPFTEKPARDLTLKDLAALRPKAHALMAKAREASTFVKTHAYFGRSCGTPLITMENTVGAIYVVRNPLDVVVSSLSYFGLDRDASIAALASKGRATSPTDQLVIEPISSWSLNVDSWTRRPHPALHVVRYEDMLDSPLKTFGAIANFLGLAPPQAQLQRAIDATSFERLQKQEAEKGFHERSRYQELFFRSGKRDQWKEVLSREQTQQVVDDHRETMARFGYIPKGF